jgi:hypothetical protein
MSQRPSITLKGSGSGTFDPRSLSEAIDKLDWTDEVAADRANIFLCEAVSNVFMHAYPVAGLGNPAEAWEVRVGADIGGRIALLSVEDWGVGVPASMAGCEVSGQLSEAELMTLALNAGRAELGPPGRGRGLASMIGTARRHPGACFEILSAGYQASFTANRLSAVRRLTNVAAGTLVALSIPMDPRGR